MVNAAQFIPQAPEQICWAECLEGCSKEGSREHIITESTLRGPQINVRGLPFLNGKVLTLDKKDFKSNILCRAHNNVLSPVDSAGSSAFDSLRDAAGANPRKKYKIDGNLLERWLLKTMINLEVISDFNVRPPIDVVEVAFGKRRVGSRAGLFLLGYSFDQGLGDERVSYTRLTSNRNQISGGRFNFRSFKLLLMISDTPFAEFQIVGGGGETKKVVPFHHPHRLQLRHQSTFVVLRWRT